MDLAGKVDALKEAFCSDSDSQEDAKSEEPDEEDEKDLQDAISRDAGENKQEEKLEEEKE